MAKKLPIGLQTIVDKKPNSKNLLAKTHRKEIPFKRAKKK